MPVEGAGGESGTATHRLANRAQRRVGERRAPGSRSRNTGMQGQAGGSMAVRGPGRRIDASNTPFNRMRHSAAREKQTHSRRAMVQARGKPGQHASAEGVPAPAQELARAARQAGEPKRRVQGKQEGAGGEPVAVGTRERKQEGGHPGAAHTLTSGVARLTCVCVSYRWSAR